MIKAVYPGSFDPISNGHLDIIERSSKLFDKVYVLVSVNPNKTSMFSLEEKVEFIKKVTSHLNNVVVDYFDGLVLEYAKKNDCNVIIRGLRNINDYQDEITMYQFNRSIDKNIETLVMFPTQNNLFLSSSSIKQLIGLNVPIDEYVPKVICKEIEEKMREKIKQ